MQRVAILGLGAMGSRVAANIVRGGYEVIVWNRHPDRTKPLVELGARAAATPKEAASQADLVVSMVRDDAASRDVWLDEQNGAIGGLRAGAVAVESSTLTLAWTRRLAERLQTAGARFIDAPMVGSRPQAEAAQLAYLVGGAAETLAEVVDVLRCSSGNVRHLGEIGSGMAFKLVVNALLGIQAAAVAEGITLLQRLGVSPAAAVQGLTGLPVLSPAAAGQASLMAAGDFAPRFPIALVAKDFACVGDASRQAGVSLPLTDAATELFTQAAARGHGEENISAIIKLLSEMRPGA